MIKDDELVRIDPEIMSGTACFSGTRVPIKNLWDYLEGGHTLDTFLDHFPTVTREQTVALLERARERVSADARAA